jgi:rare lipoprotein A
MTLQRKSLAVVAATALFCAHALAQSTVAPAAAPAVPPAAPVPAASPAPAAPAADTEQGKLAWYGAKFAGRKTASGQRYDPNALTMAHKTLPFGTRVKVTNLANKRSVELRVNDRGPTQADRIGDVSHAAAKRLGMVRAGVIDAEVTVIAAPATKQG